MIFAIIILAVSSTALAGTCSKPSTVSGFNFQKFSGNWYLTSMEVDNPMDASIYHDLRCANLNFGTTKVDNVYGYYVHFFTGAKENNVSGFYSVPDSAVGHYKINFPPAHITYDFYVVCSDHTTYSLVYACAQKGPGATSEFVSLTTRDPRKYNEIVARDDVKKCFSKIRSKPITDLLIKVNYSNCPHLKF